MNTSQSNQMDDQCSMAIAACLPDLLNRVEALADRLEAASQSAHVDLSHLSDAERGKMLKSLANPGRFEALQPAQPAQPNYPVKPDSSLVDRVEDAIFRTGDEPGFRGEARAAIREVAAWMREQKPCGIAVWAQMLEGEAKR